MQKINKLIKMCHWGPKCFCHDLTSHLTRTL